MKRRSMSPVTTETQIETTARCHFTPTGVAITKNRESQALARMRTNGHARALLVGMETGWPRETQSGRPSKR